MYSYEERMKAVELYIKYDLNLADTIQELGYPSRNMLARWYKEYLATGELHGNYKKKPKYSSEQMQAAVAYYLNHGCSITRTIRTIGYPSRPVLREWIDALAPGKRKSSIKDGTYVRPFSQKQRQNAVIELCTRAGSAASIAEQSGTSRASLYKWKRRLLDEKDVRRMDRFRKLTLPDDRDTLLADLESLKQQIYRQQMELDILNKAAEIVKKDLGIDPRRLANKEKASLIDALRTNYPLSELLMTMKMSKSSYFYQRKAQSTPDKYKTLRNEIQEIFAKNKGRYGYRRVHAAIKSAGVTISEKVVRRIMREEQLTVPYKKRRKYSSYQGEVSPAVDNLVARDFHAAKPNTKWLTDLTEFRIPAGKVYLSPIVDCFDGLVVSWAIGTSPDANLVNTMLKNAIDHLAEGETPIVHTDRGAHYRWPGWISLMENAGLTRSMSKKGCSPDNAACEGFFGRVKNELFYNRSWKDTTIKEFIEELDTYLRWYNEERIKLSVGSFSPLAYRRSLGLVA